MGRWYIRDLIADLLIISLSSALLWHFSNIWRYGQYFAAEPNIIIRSLETVGLLLILVFGLSKYISDLRRGLKGKGDRSESQ